MEQRWEQADEYNDQLSSFLSYQLAEGPQTNGNWENEIEAMKVRGVDTLKEQPKTKKCEAEEEAIRRSLGRLSP